ncbi:MAG: hypothetical protein KBG20_18450 [Caldilineaceae bacterium]|nr:hypothetical protein [Caldilineaceae bacterium]MBP8108085.1 hypothetical protein [Caldilineaceae bacterium]MBP8124347.1 hypothetical protein [Caldilineaceae bacterium]MBP9074294.1 hypothetical protein [Caldilineaceae bacterium]
MIIHKLISFFVALGMVLTPISPAQPVQSVSAQSVAQPEKVEPGAGVLFRTHITVDQPTDWARLAELDVVILNQGETDAMVLADFDQLANLTRLGFQPTGTDEFSALVMANGAERPWMAKAVGPVLERSKTMQTQVAQRSLGPVGADEAETVQALTSLRVVVQALTPEVKAALADSFSLDDDGDGLTNTEESWWCTDPLNPNSDGDAQGYTDGQEVAALLDVTVPRSVRWGYGPPYRAWPPFVKTIAVGEQPTCLLDSDEDSIPDLAEIYVIGTRVPAESTDFDKFDDGQELFGVTKSAYGDYPRSMDSDFITSEMPRWVLPPGDNPFVAAFPVPEVYVLADPATGKTWNVERVTTITTSQGEMVEKTNSYETAVTRGQSTSIANTVTWNEWEEVSQAVETPIRTKELLDTRKVETPAVVPLIFVGIAAAGGTAAAIGAGAAAVSAVSDVIQTHHMLTDTTGKDTVAELQNIGKYTSDIAKGVNTSNERLSDINGTLKDGFQLTGQSLKSIDNTLGVGFQNVTTSLDGIQQAIDQQGRLIARGLHDISYQISRPRLTETKTNGKSWGGAQTTTHEVYEEHTISQGEAFTSGQNWSTAWAVNSSHAADLTFRYAVQNSGTEYARELTNLVFNIYIGDDKLPAISYSAWEQFANGKLDNLFPVGPNTPPGVISSKTYASNPIPLSLEQMKRIDLGERLTVKVENFSFGADENFYVNAISGGVTVFIEDGVEDGDESVDQYVIPTWGAETVQDVLTRYFPAGYDAEGNLNALWTPEFNGDAAPAWNEHFLSDIAWWNVYLTQADAGDTPLHLLPARDGSGILFRFNRDSDRDGYNDRAEFRYYCALPASHAESKHCADGHLRAEIHPQPELLAGYVTERNGAVVTVKLALENTGSFDAYGIDAVLYSPDETTTIGNNTVGGNGVVRAGRQVVVGSLIKAPGLGEWGNSRAKPYAAGQFSGAADRTFTFSAQTPGVVGTGSTAVAWNDGAGNSGLLNLGGDYRAPLPLDVAQGLQVGFNTGTIDAGASFTVTALTPRDTFTFTVNSEPFTPPVVVVSYSDPQGSRRFVTPVQLPWLGDALSPHADGMLKGLAVQIVSEGAFNPAGPNRTSLIVNSPHPATIRDGHLHLNFVSDGKLVLEKSYTLDFPAGPTTFTAEWAASDFSADYKPAGDNLLIAFWTDSENNIIDSGARPLNSFAADPKPAADSNAALWDFGTVTQGEVLKRSVSIASIGDIDLLAYVTGAPGLSVSQTGSKPLGLGDLASYELSLDTRTLPTGPYTGTATLRTSDPARPLYTVQVTGEIAPLFGDAYARKVEDRPLDVEVWVDGSHSQGEWITYTHSLGPDAGSLHPVKVYDTNSVLQGVGSIATDFSEGTASAEMFGDGRDGVMPGSGNLDYEKGFGVGTVNGTAGSTSIDVVDHYAVSRINPDDMVLIHQTRGSGVGQWELNRAINDFTGSGTFALEKPLKYAYFTNGGNDRAQILRVPQFTDCPVTGTVTPLSAWAGDWGGIFAIMCSGTMNIAGNIDASGFGFRGGSSVSAPCGDRCTGPSGFQGESYNGMGGQSPSPNGGGGGAGGGDAWGGGQGGAGAGGGGYGSDGGGGNRGEGGNASPGSGGVPYGVADLHTLIHAGSGGGSGGSDDLRGLVSGPGGRGGGILIVLGKSIQISGAMIADGSNGGNSNSQYSGPGGGGSGGSIFIVGQNISNQGIVRASGGSGACREYGCSGNGGTGRIRIEFCESLTGSDNPLITTKKLNCSIVEQIASSTTLLNLPKLTSETRTYRIQYGRKLDFTAEGEMLTTLRLPSGVWTSASLDALVSGVGSGDVTFKLDVGADGTWEWDETKAIDNAGTFYTDTLAAAFAPYVSGNGDVDVDVKVYLSKPGQVLLTNMAVSRERSVELAPQLALSGTPTEGAVVPLNATVANTGTADSGPLTVSYYATQHAARSTQYIGSVFIPNIPGAGTEAAPFQWDTLGFVGPMTVTATVDPFNRTAEVNEANNSALAPFTILTRPDLAFNPTGITLSDDEPVVGETVTVTASLKNNGQTATASQKTVLYRGNPESSGVQLQSNTVSTIGPGANRNVVFTWTPTTTGWHRLFIRTDKDGQINESDEGNNDRWLDVYVGVAGPVLLDSGPGEPVYSESRGNGVIDADGDDVTGSCGDAAYQSFRRDPNGPLAYRFDHLLPGHFYHLDITLYNCPGEAQRLETVTVDNVTLTASAVDLGDQQVHRLSFLVDPALYALDRSVAIVIAADGVQGTVVSEVNLHDVDYRYADAGGQNDPRYPGSRTFGWEDGSANTAWGTLPAHSVRVDQTDRELVYRFDGLRSDKRYTVHLAFRQGSGSTSTALKVQIDGVDSGSTFNVATGERVDKHIAVSPIHYQSDGSIRVGIVRPDANGPFVNEIALEEETVEAAVSCVALPTPSGMDVFGTVTINGAPAPVGTVIQAINPRGDTVGCVTVVTAGAFPFVRVYGEDAGASPPIPGMRDGERITFRVTGALAKSTPSIYWQEGGTVETALDAGPVDGQSLLLNPPWNLISLHVDPPAPLAQQVFGSIENRYDLALSETGVFIPGANPLYNTLKEIHCGQAYYVRVTGTTTANLLAEGLTCPADTPLPLHAGWNWIGYLPSTSLPVAQALASIDGKYQRVLGISQTYIPGSPASNLTHLEPGQGYLVYMNEAATLVYPTSPAASMSEHVEAVGLCGGVQSTPYATLLYGEVTINGQLAPVGSRIELVTTQGNVAGCIETTEPGFYRATFAYGADETASPRIPGFAEGEPILVQVNGMAVPVDVPLLWSDDKDLHRVDLALNGIWNLYMPSVQQER